MTTSVSALEANTLPGDHGTAASTRTDGHRLSISFRSPGAHWNTPDVEAGRRILSAALAILSQGEDLLARLNGEQYARRIPVAFNASIGGHYRHCLDHFASLLRGLNAEEVDYDHRDRDQRIETDAQFARQLTRRLRTDLEQIPPSVLIQSVPARCEVSYEHGQSPITGSTLGRELAYCIAHAIHHYALIAVMARLMEAPLPENFGVAPSTVAYLARQQAPTC